MLDETIKVNDELIAKIDATLKENEQELSDAKAIIKIYEKQSENILIVKRSKLGRIGLGKKPITPTISIEMYFSSLKTDKRKNQKLVCYHYRKSRHISFYCHKLVNDRRKCKARCNN